MSDPDRDNRKLAWAFVRLLLGQAQIIGAVAGAYLLLSIGLNATSLSVVLCTCLCTTISLLLFRGRKP